MDSLGGMAGLFSDPRQLGTPVQGAKKSGDTRQQHEGRGEIQGVKWGSEQDTSSDQEQDHRRGDGRQSLPDRTSPRVSSVVTGSLLAAPDLVGVKTIAGEVFDSVTAGQLNIGQ